MTRPRLRSALPEVFQTAAAGSPPLQAVLTVADAMLGPVADVLDTIEVVADPYRAPDHVAAALAWWVDLGWLTTGDAHAAYQGVDGPPAAGVAPVQPADSSALTGPSPASAAALELPGPTPPAGRPSRRPAGRADTAPRLRAAVPRGIVGLRDLVAAAPELAAQRGTAAGLVRFLELATGATGWRLEVDPEECHVRVHLPPSVAGDDPVIRAIVETVKPAHVTASIEAQTVTPSLPTAPAASVETPVVESTTTTTHAPSPTPAGAGPPPAEAAPPAPPPGHQPAPPGPALAPTEVLPIVTPTGPQTPPNP